MIVIDTVTSTVISMLCGVFSSRKSQWTLPHLKLIVSYYFFLKRVGIGAWIKGGLGMLSPGGDKVGQFLIAEPLY